MNSEKQYQILPVKLMAAKPPVFLEKSGKDYIFYGDKNNYPQYLIELYRRSVMHQAIISKKVRLICGGGWKIVSAGLNVEEQSILAQWIKKPNDIEDFGELTKKITTDLEMFDGVALELIYNKAGTKLVSINHLPFQNVRSNKDGSEFYYTSQWEKTSASGAKSLNSQPQDAPDYKVFKPFDPKKKSDKSQLYYYQCYSVGKEVYPLPNYIAGVTAIETEARIDNFWLNFIKKGFAVSHKINFYNGIPPKEEQDKIFDDIKEKFSGDDAEDVILVTFSNDKDHGSEIETLTPSDFDKQYQELKASTQQSILTCHSIPDPEILGIPTPKGFTSAADQRIVNMEEFQNYYVTPRQEIIEYIFNDILGEEGKSDKMKLIQMQPVGLQYSEDLIRSVIPQAALRDMVADKLGIDLKRYLTNPTPVTTPVAQNKNFSKADDSLVDVFRRYGISKEGITIKKSSEFEFTSDEDLDKSENLLSMTFEENKDGLTTGLPSGEIEIPIKGTPKIDTQVVYSYEGPQDSKNRDFCAKMLMLNRFYTKEDMRSINVEIRSNDVYNAAYGDLDINVWKHRGGWYREEGSDVSVPRCRHSWLQHLILKV